MIDVSDGLLRDLGRVAEASGASMELRCGDGPLAAWRDSLAHVATELEGEPARGRRLAWEWVLGGGEDHALAACFPAGSTLPPSFEVVGTVVRQAPDRPAVLVEEGLPTGGRGWDHFGG